MSTMHETVTLSVADEFFHVAGIARTLCDRYFGIPCRSEVGVLMLLDAAICVCACIEKGEN